MSEPIAGWEAELHSASVTGVADFIKKVQCNARESQNVEDFLCEARAALMFRENGFLVRMQDKPDLELKYSRMRLFAEVKHFRLKNQDIIDETRLMNAGRQALEDSLSTLVPFGDTRTTEGKCAWQQLVDVARRKTSQYRDNSPNILVIFSSSPHCIGDAEADTAAHAIDEDIATEQTPGLAKLNGLLLVTERSRKWPSTQVYFAPVHHSAVSLSKEITDVLSAIRVCRWNP